MTIHYGDGSNGGGGRFVKWFVFAILLCQVLSLPKPLEDDVTINKIFSESKRDITSSKGTTSVPLKKLPPVFNPYFAYPVVSGKPMFLPPFITASDTFFDSLTKFDISSTKTPLIDGADTLAISSYFKLKKDEFLSKLFEKLANTTAASGINARSITDDDLSSSAKPVFDPSFFIKKKFEFLDTLFKTINATTATTTVNATENENNESEPTVKPTIVPPDFWFPFPKTAKTPKPPKPTKPPKAKKVLKDALDTILLQSLLLDLGVDPKDASFSKRATLGDKKSKSKKTDLNEPKQYHIPMKVNPVEYTSKASDCLNKLFKLLNKTGEEDLDNFIEPKATVLPTNLWSKPSETEYTSKLDAFLDLLLKSLDATESYQTQSGKPEKSKTKPGKKFKRSSFLDELLHRVTTPVAPTTPNPVISPQDFNFDSEYEALLKEFIKECCCNDKDFPLSKGNEKKARSLIYKPFGSGFWIPQYIYAAKMGTYLAKLMDSLKTEAVSEVDTENSDIVKRSLDPATDDASRLLTKDEAINLIISELTNLKNDLVDAFTDGIKAQKDAMFTPKPYGSGSSKSFKKPFWGSKFSPTSDPVAPIQKRIDVLNDVFDKLTKVEKTLIFTSEPEYDSKLIANLTEILDLTSPKSKVFKTQTYPTKPSENVDSPAYLLAKTKEYLQNLYAE